jgi:MFS family permease
VIREGLNLSHGWTGLVAVVSLVALAATVLGAGALGDKLGMRRMFLAGSVGVVVFGLFSAAAPNGWSLVAARVGVGICFSFPLALSLSIVRQAFPAGRVERAIALFVGASTGFAIIPPIVGSELIYRFGWRTGLLTTPFLAAVLVASALRYVPETPRVNRPLDVPGMLISVVALSALLYGISDLRGGVHATALVYMAVGVAGVLVFWWWERRADSPALDPSLFRSRSLVAATVAGASYCFVMGGSAAVFTAYMVIVRGSPATMLHLLYIPGTLLAAFTAIGVGRAAARLGESTVMIGGLVLLAAVVAARLVLGENTAMFVVAVVMATSAMAGAVVQTTLTTVLMTGTPASLGGVVSALRSNVQSTSYALGAATLPLLGIAAFQIDGGERLAEQHVTSEQARNALRLAHMHGTSRGVPTATGLEPQRTDGALSAATSIWIEVGWFLSLFMSVVCLAAAVVVFAILRPGSRIGRSRWWVDTPAT